MPLRRRSFVLLAALSLAAGAVPHFLVLPGKSPLPSQLAGLQCVRTLDGDPAREIVDRMHGKNVSPDRTIIGVYRGGERTATLYLSLFATAEEARAGEQVMARRIRAGNAVFSHFHEVTAEGKLVSVCYGLGQAHFFFSDGRKLYWLSADLPVAYETLRAILGNDR